MDEIMLQIPEAARRFQCSRAKLYDLISDGLIPVVKLGPGDGAGVRIRLRDLEQYAADNAKHRRAGRGKRSMRDEGTLREAAPGSTAPAVGHDLEGEADAPR